MKSTRARMLFACLSAAMMAWMLAVSLPTQAADVSPATAPATQPADVSPADVEASIKTWLVDLANADAAVREEALAHLLNLHPDNLMALKKVARESQPLLPPQAVVLREIVTQVFLSGEDYHHTDQGFLGVMMERTSVSFRDLNADSIATPSFGIVITDRSPGFVGARMLRDGDIILAILDRPDVHLSTTEEFSSAIKAMGPGAIAHLQVLRQGQVIEVTIMLDHRPLEADAGLFDIRDLAAQRRKLSEDYWNREFASLLRGNIS